MDYYLPKGASRPLDPPLPPGAEHGITMGLWDINRGLRYSLDAAVHKMKGKKNELEFKSYKYP